MQAMQADFKGGPFTLFPNFVLVVVLDGGLPKWISEGRPIEDGPAAPQERHFTPRYQADIYRSLEQMREIVATGREQAIDARAAGRSEGRDPDPRAGLRGGHMPGARNLPLAAMIAPDGTCCRPTS